MDNLIEKINEFINDLNDINEEKSFSSAEFTKYKLWAILPYFIPILFFMPIVKDSNSGFCKFHANQQLAWLIIAIICSAVAGVIGLIPILGTIIKGAVILLMVVAAAILAYAGYQGKAVRIPFLGNMKVF